MDRLSEMEAFAAVVDQGGFTGAANKLGVSKSAVSKHVSALENRLGVRLLNRTTRRVNPTEVGLVYYDLARTALTAAREADMAVTSLVSEPTGTLRLVVATDFGTQVLSPMISSFLKRHPGVDIDMDLTDSPAETSSEGFDMLLRLGHPAETGRRTQTLDTVTYYLAASPDYLEKAGMPGRIEDLAQHRLLQTRGIDGTASWRLTAPSGEVRVVRTGGRFSANSGLCVRDNARAGLGIAFLPDFLIGADLADGRLRPVLPALPPQTTPLIAICAPDRAVLPRVRAFFDFLRDMYSRPTSVAMLEA